ncbi:MAG: hypothetical protein WA133_05640 [Syntrophales bacterium]
MKRFLMVVLALGLICTISPGWAAGPNQCTTIQSGSLVNSAGDVIRPGYDQWGYNYQALMFNGDYCDSYRNAAWCQPYKGINLIMKWNDGWLSNSDCNGDGLLDRHNGFATYRGSGAWLTNHQSGKVDVNGKTKQWTYFVKIVAAPLDAVSFLGDWYTASGVKIGPMIWGDFAVIQEIYDDPSAGQHGVLFKSPAGPGFGIYGVQK